MNSVPVNMRFVGQRVRQLVLEKWLLKRLKIGFFLAWGRLWQESATENMICLMISKNAHRGASKELGC